MYEPKPFKSIDEIIQQIGTMFQTTDTQMLVARLVKTKKEGKPIK